MDGGEGDIGRAIKKGRRRLLGQRASQLDKGGRGSVAVELAVGGTAAELTGEMALRRLLGRRGRREWQAGAQGDWELGNWGSMLDACWMPLPCHLKLTIIELIKTSPKDYLFYS